MRKSKTERKEGGRDYRIEKDTLGYIKVPKPAYYGAQTQRAVENFRISELRMQKEFIKAQAIIKKACAIANLKFKRIEKEKAEAIIKACDEIISGKEELLKNFVVDVYSAGAGVSLNMNINEVIANRALEILGYEKGSYDKIHPNDDVNLGQSTNDTIRSAINIAGYLLIKHELIPALEVLKNELYKKAEEFKSIAKAGRTHMQDAVPMSLGQEFSGYARAVELGIERIKRASEDLRELNIGGNAVGTGINNPENFPEIVVDEIKKETKENFKSAKNLFEATQNIDSVANTSSAIRAIASSLLKIAQDIILLSSGPRTGLNEIYLKPLQPGSSIMPGKVNPVIPEMLSMVACDVVARDLSITIAQQHAKLELNIFMPIVAYNFMHEIKILANACQSFAELCIKHIKANKEVCERYAENTLALAIMLSPVIGYEKAAEVAREAMEKGKSIKSIVIEKGIMGKEEAEKFFNLRRILWL